KQSKRGQSSQSLHAAGEHPSRVGREQGDRGSASDQKAPVETDPLGERQQQQIEDDLGDSDQNVLCGVNPLAGRNLKCEVGKEKETDEKEYILERSADGLIWICHFDERSAECRCLKSGEDVARSFRPHAPGDEWDRPFRGETTPCDRAADRQEASVESRIWPI